MAFFPTGMCGIPTYMERKYPNFVKEWRKHRGLTQKQLIARLIELTGEDQDAAFLEARVPTTEASLSRIENGHQNFNMAMLQALADALNVDQPGWLLDRNPLKSAEVVDFVGRLDAKQQEQASAVLHALFGEEAITA